MNSAAPGDCADWARATEDRVVRALDIERAITRGEKAYELGLLARANRGFLDINELNLLEDHIVNLLLDVAQPGENVVERDGLSIRHAARFVLVGSGNPEEGELRPQLLDRFGLAVEVGTQRDPAERVEVILRREGYERDHAAFVALWQAEDAALCAQIVAARAALAQVQAPNTVLYDCATLCIAIGSDGLRGELTLLRAGRALAAFEGGGAVTRDHIRRVSGMVLAHRLRRDPLDEAGSAGRITRAVAEHLP